MICFYTTEIIFQRDALLVFEQILFSEKETSNVLKMVLSKILLNQIVKKLKSVHSAYLLGFRISVIDFFYKNCTPLLLR